MLTARTSLRREDDEASNIGLEIQIGQSVRRNGCRVRRAGALPLIKASSLRDVLRGRRAPGHA